MRQHLTSELYSYCIRSEEDFKNIFCDFVGCIKIFINLYNIDGGRINKPNQLDLIDTKLYNCFVNTYNFFNTSKHLQVIKKVNKHLLSNVNTFLKIIAFIIKVFISLNKINVDF